MQIDISTENTFDKTWDLLSLRLAQKAIKTNGNFLDFVHYDHVFYEVEDLIL